MLLGALAGLVVVAGCTDYDAGQAPPTPLLYGYGGSFSSLAAPDAGGADGAALVHVDSWQPPRGQPDTHAAPDTAAPPSRRAPDIIWWDTAPAGVDVSAPDAGAIDAGQPDAGTADVGAVDAGPVDSGSPEVAGTDAGGTDAGPVDTGVEDMLAVDAGTPDAGTLDAGTLDAGTPDIGSPDAAIGDAAGLDAGSPDVLMADSAGPDAGQPDVTPWDAAGYDAADAAPWDAAGYDVADAAPWDAAGYDAPDAAPWDAAGYDVADAAPWDGLIADAAAPPDDATWDPDWGGYSDVSYPDGADIYGGTVNSCFTLYAFVFQEACKNDKLDAACVNKNAKEGSLFAQTQFDPVRLCAQANCVDKCAGPGSADCVQECMGKHCTYPFFSCLTAGEAGTNDCASTFDCLQKYEGMIFSIANYCFGNATHAAQKQVADFFACGQKPQSGSCVAEIAACWGPPGGSTCLEAIQCSEKCPKGDDPCGFQCIASADADGRDKLDKLWDCTVEKCSDCQGPNGCGDACNQKQCAPEITDCLLDK